MNRRFLLDRLRVKLSDVDVLQRVIDTAENDVKTYFEEHKGLEEHQLYQEASMRAWFTSRKWDVHVEWTLGDIPFPRVSVSPSKDSPYYVVVPPKHADVFVFVMVPLDTTNRVYIATEWRLDSY